MSSSGMGKRVSAEGTGKDRQETYGDLATTIQPSLNLPDPQQNLEAIAETYDVLRECVKLFGGRKLLAIELGKQIDYEAHLANGLNRRDDRHAFVDWIVPLLRSPKSGGMLIEWLCVLAGYEKPKRRGLPDPAAIAKAFLEDAEESGRHGDDQLKRVAKRLGTDIGGLKR